MRITLNLATRPYADQRPAIKRLRIGMAVLAVILLGLGLGLLHFHQAALRMEAQEEALDRSVARLGHEEQGYRAQMQQPANARVLTQAEFLNGLFEEKSFSWTAAMEDMERVLPGGVQVTAIEPTRGKDGRLTLRIRVSGLRERSVELVRNMEHSHRFVLPRISGENAEISAQGELQRASAAPGRVSFDILAEYNPATLAERKAAAGQKHTRAAEEPGSAGAPMPPQPVPMRQVPPGQSQVRQQRMMQPRTGYPTPLGDPDRNPNQGRFQRGQVPPHAASTGGPQ